MPTAHSPLAPAQPRPQQSCPPLSRRLVAKILPGVIAAATLAWHDEDLFRLGFDLVHDRLQRQHQRVRTEPVWRCPFRGEVLPQICLQRLDCSRHGFLPKEHRLRRSQPGSKGERRLDRLQPASSSGSGSGSGSAGAGSSRTFTQRPLS